MCVCVCVCVCMMQERKAISDSRHVDMYMYYLMPKDHTIIQDVDNLVSTSLLHNLMVSTRP